ncbi:rhomboid family intramembrane serine protease [Candidatus Woesearchaeota archaeon]|nr:rhomboid family intramembrane serine protease [Candidatus Woesearchaeota archaeon]
MARKKRVKHAEHHYIREVGHHIETETQLIGKIFAWIFQAKLTMFLIILNLIVYFVSLTWSNEFFNSLVFRPEHIMQMNFLPEIASWFLHANPTHLIGNLIFLFIFGRVCEKRFGIIKFFLIYFGSAIISDLVAGLLFGQGGIGASGAIFGVVAAAIIIDPFYFTYLFFGIPLPIVAVGWIFVFADLSGIISPIVGDNTGHIAHLAGFFGITLLVFLLNIKKEKIRTGLLVNFVTLILGVLFYIFAPSVKIPFVGN